jgi:hypothetical protein
VQHRDVPYLCRTHVVNDTQQIGHHVGASDVKVFDAPQTLQSNKGELPASSNTGEEEEVMRAQDNMLLSSACGRILQHIACIHPTLL